MTENELRNKVVSMAESFLEYNEANGSHKKIIDIYNSHKPLAQNYRVQYTDSWCSTFVSVVSIKCGITDILPTECGCERHIQLFKKLNRWVENENNYKPKAGDVIFYDWQDNGIGDNQGFSDHVGIVVSVTGNTIKVIEGNMSNAVGYRNIAIGGKGIRGYGIPNYASKAGSMKDDNITPAKPTTSTTTSSASLEYKVGDIVKFTGTKHYASANASSGSICKSGTAKVTAISKNTKHPYHLVAEKGKGSTVYGWVNVSDISGKVSSVSTSGGSTSTTVNAKVKVESAQSFSKSLTGTYKATANLNMRTGAGTSKPVLLVIPSNSRVDCYGYYTSVKGVKWYYVTYKNSKGVVYNGFVSSQYLKK